MAGPARDSASYGLRLEAYGKGDRGLDDDTDDEEGRVSRTGHCWPVFLGLMNLHVKVIVVALVINKNTGNPKPQQRTVGINQLDVACVDEALE